MKQQIYWFGVWALLAVSSVACTATPAVSSLSPAVVPTQSPAIEPSEPAPTAAAQPSAIVPLADVASIALPESLPTPNPGLALSQPAAYPPSLPKRITFPPGSTSATLQGALMPNGMDTYVLRALAGQTLAVNVSSSATRFLLQIVGANGYPLKTFGAGPSNWSGRLPTTQDYLISIIAENGGAAMYGLQVVVPPLASPPPADRQPTRIAFPPGGTSASLQGTLAPNEMDTYALRALAGQTLIVNASSFNTPLLLQIVGADGNPLKTFGAGSSNWSGLLPTTQDYLISLMAENAVSATYALQVAVPPLATPPPADRPPTRIAFPPGGTSATLWGNLLPNTINRYILRALAGQTMTVAAYSRQGNLLLQIVGADGNPLKTFGVGSSNWSGVLPRTQDYIISIASENSGAATYSLLIAIPPATPVDSQPKRIQFAWGTTRAIVQARLAINTIDAYVLRAMAGQTLRVNVSSPAHVLLAINGADGTVLKSSGAGTSIWSGILQKTQDYFLSINAEDGMPATYTLQVEIPAVIP